MLVNVSMRERGQRKIKGAGAVSTGTRATGFGQDAEAASSNYTMQPRPIIVGEWFPMVPTPRERFSSN